MSAISAQTFLRICKSPTIDLRYRKNDASLKIFIKGNFPEN